MVRRSNCSTRRSKSNDATEHKENRLKKGLIRKELAAGGTIFESKNHGGSNMSTRDVITIKPSEMSI